MWHFQWFKLQNALKIINKKRHVVALSLKYYYRPFRSQIALNDEMVSECTFCLFGLYEYWTLHYEYISIRVV